MEPDFYRFEQKTEDVSMLKGSTNSYFIRTSDMSIVATCVVKGRCITHPTIFHRFPEIEQRWFLMEAKRKLLNMAYFLFEPGQSRPFSTITCRGRGHWRILDDAENEVCGFIDTSTRAGKVAESVLGGSPDKYAVVSGKRVLAHIRMEPRPEEGSPAQEQSFLKRALKAFTRKSDWVLSLEQGVTELDHRSLVAGMILLLEHTITMARSK